MHHAVFWPFFLIGPLFWIALIVVFAVVFSRRRRGWGAPGGPGGWGPHSGPGPWGRAPWTQSPTAEAERTLAGRYANGDIDEKEYRARLEVLRANRPGPEA